MLVQKNENGIWIIVLDKDQKLLSTLTDIIEKENIKGGHLSAIGAIKNAELGFYHLDQKDYEKKLFDQGDFELVSLNGNVSLKDGQTYVHAHAALGKSDFSLIGGHLFEAEVAVTAEIYLTPFGAMPERQLQEDIGLATLASCKI